CIEKVNIKNFSPLKKGYKDKKEVCDLNPKYEIISEKEMIGILFWLYDFAYNYKIGKKKLSKYDQSLNLNIQHIFKRVHEIYISKSQVVKLMNNFRILYWQVLGLLNMYFINSKVFLKDYENDNQYRFLTGYKNRFWYKFDPYRKMLFYYIMNKLNNNPKEGYGEFTPLLVTFKDAKFTKDELNSFKENPIMYNWSESKVLYDIFRNNSWEDNIHLENWFFNKS
ncbi:MAG: hypothetical protein GY830_05485, partial [Bacteroidetes bacterium]|nr:hypothetical protein [Bacteroidota bacterium]